MVKNIFKKLFCRHKETDIICWHWSHGHDGQTKCIEVQVRCKTCGKYYCYDIHGHEKCDAFSLLQHDKQVSKTCYPMHKYENIMLNEILEIEDIDKLLNKASRESYLSGIDFSVLMQRLLIAKDEYVIDIGNYENVNAVVALSLIRNIKRHPILWEIIFHDYIMK